ncbi:MAG TPA: hypothetical protein VGR51_02220 [Thermoplasmata archaeon]|jgi:hypothetical protein|nr:hypothetical protein [Thermoplasmata archaeon]
MFGVVVCPRCGRAKAVELPKKATECPCGFEIRVLPSQLRFESPDAREVAAAVGRVNAEIHGGLAEVEALEGKPKRRPKGAYARVITAASRAGDRRQRMRAAAEGLAREFILFSIEDWRQVAGALGVPDAVSALEELVRGNVVYEPKPGFYRTV